MPSPSEPAAVPIIRDVDEAARRLRAGGLVAVPTETVYGLAAVADDARAVGRIFDVKGRPRDHPLIVHISGAADLDRWAVDVPDAARRLVAACWPGPLTVLLHRHADVLDRVTGGRPTVGLRAPAHALTQELLASLDTGLAAPSANRFGRVSPTSAEHVVADLAGLLDPATDAVLDGGTCPVGVESTIVDCTVDPPQVLRPGAITVDEITEVLAAPLGDASGPSRASGMLESHYAPRCAVVLASDSTEARALVAEHSSRGATVAVIDYGDDFVEYARRLYADLREADHAAVDVVVAVLPPASGLGHAVRDRLMKAAAGRAPRDRPSRDD